MAAQVVGQAVALNTYLGYQMGSDIGQLAPPAVQVAVVTPLFLSQ